VTLSRDCDGSAPFHLIFFNMMKIIIQNLFYLVFRKYY